MLEDLEKKVLLAAVEKELLAFDDVVRLLNEEQVESLFAEACKDTNTERSSSSPVAPPEKSAPEVVGSGSTFGCYENLQLIGEGAMGKVYKAFHISLERFVALKILKTQDKEMKARFVREAHALAKIEHPHVCKIFESGEIASHAYISMQLVIGKTLKDLPDEFGLEAKVQLIRDAALGLHAAHKAGLVHRDLKPSNIMVQESEDGSRHVYDMDFGVARHLEAPDLTTTGALIGSPLYMSPEQARGENKSIDRRTDVYALGTILYELLVGAPPFQSELPGMVIKEIIEKYPVRPRKLNDKIPKDIDTIILKCLEKDPGGRYDSSKALAEDLDRYLNGDPVAARPTGTLARLIQKARKNKTIAALSIGSFIAVTVFGGIGLHATLTAKSRAQFAQEFGEEVKEIETSLRLAYLAPLHPVTVEKQRVFKRIENIYSKIGKMGSISRGPGYLAIGKGYLALQEYEKAYEALQRAYEEHFNPRDVAYSLGVASGRLYQRELQEAAKNPNKAFRIKGMKEAEAKYRASTLSYLESGMATGKGNVSYGKALLSFYENDHTKALQEARNASNENSSLYEAVLLEGDILVDVATRESSTGKYESAASYFKRAAAFYNTAANHARSDPLVYMGMCSLAENMITMCTDLGSICLKEFQEGETACNNGLIADSDYVPLLEAKASLYLAWSENMARTGQDPTSFLEKSITSSSRAIELGSSDSAPELIARAYLNQGEYFHDHGTDPENHYRKAIALSEEKLRKHTNNWKTVLNLANGYWLLGLYESENGRNPTELLTKSVKQYESVLREVQDIRIYLNKGNAFQIMGTYAFDNGKDNSRSFLNESNKAYLQATNINPQSSVPYANAAITDFYLGLISIRSGNDPKPEFESSLKNCEKSVQLNLADEFAFIMKGITNAHWANYLFQNGKNPSGLADTSIEAFLRSLSINPDSSVSYANLTLPYLTKAEYALIAGTAEVKDNLAIARNYAKKAIEVDSDDSWNHYVAGRTEWIAGDLLIKQGGRPTPWEAAANHYKKSLELNTTSSETLRALAGLQAEMWYTGLLQGEHSIQEAIGLAEKALAINKMDPENHESAATVVFLASMRTKDAVQKSALIRSATEHIDRAIALNSKRANSYALKALVCFHTVNPIDTLRKSTVKSAECGQAEEKALRLNPSSFSRHQWILRY